MAWLSFASFVRKKLLSEGEVYVLRCWRAYNELRQKFNRKLILLSSAYRTFSFLESILLIQRGDRLQGESRYPKKHKFSRQYFEPGPDFKNEESWNCPQGAYDMIFSYTIRDPVTGWKLPNHSLGRKYQELVHP